MSDEKLKINEYTIALHKLFNSMKRYHACDFDSEIMKRIPKNGIYVIFENGEITNKLDRIVRIGTHTGDKQLPSRLKQHFITENKDRSIFRKHIGRAILLKNGDKKNFIKQWGKNFTKLEVRNNPENGYDSSYLDKKNELEKLVTKYMHDNISFVVFPVKTKEERLYLEKKLISTLSWSSECVPSKEWLGNFANNDRITNSGLWNIEETFGDGDTWLNEEDMKKIRKYCDEEC